MRCPDPAPLTDRNYRYYLLFCLYFFAATVFAAACCVQPYLALLAPAHEGLTGSVHPPSLAVITLKHTFVRSSSRALSALLLLVCAPCSSQANDASQIFGPWVPQLEPHLGHTSASTLRSLRLILELSMLFGTFALALLVWHGASARFACICVGAAALVACVPPGCPGVTNSTLPLGLQVISW
jgi:hypothetical protein